MSFLFCSTKDSVSLSNGVRNLLKPGTRRMRKLSQRRRGYREGFGAYPDYR
jgi:hypothetical protein